MTHQVELNDSFSQAIEHHRAGRRSRAETLYRKILQEEPLHDKTLYLLGTMELEANRYHEAIGLLIRATEAAPRMPAYHTNLGVALRRAGQHELAAKSLLVAVELKPDFAEAHYNLALTLINLGDMNGAVLALQRAVDLKPDNLDMQRHFARLLHMRGDLERAIGHYHCAMVLGPGSWDCIPELLQVLRALRRWGSATALAQRAVAMHPQSAAAHNELGIQLHRTELTDEALAALSTAIALDGDCAEAHANLGIVLGDSGFWREGIESYRKALGLRPDWHWVHSNIIFIMMFIPGVSEVEILAEARRWSKTFAPRPSPARIYGNERVPGKRLRIGYVSPNFHDHCQSFFTTGMFAEHDRDQFEVFCYSRVESPDERTEHLAASADVWRTVLRTTDEQLADQIAGDKIDILVDLTMHMANTALPVFARKPAPVQITWLAYPGTTGLECMDYRITDRYLDPVENGPGPYSERSLVLPETFWCYDPLTNEPEPGPLPAMEKGYVTFGCLNHFRKINSEVLELWARVLVAVGSSRLVMLAPEGNARSRPLAFLQSCGVDPARVEFVPRLRRSEYLAVYTGIDVGLDSFPYCGHTTSLDAFWMGVPVISMLGSTVVGRACLSLAMNLDVAHLVAKTPEEYVTKAQALVSNIEMLGRLRQELRPRMQRSPLMDYARFARNMERAYRKAWTLWCEGEATDQAPIQIDED